MSGNRHWVECIHEQGIFAQMMSDLAADHAEKQTVLVDATYLKVNRAASSLTVKGKA
ncbi:hypothetical protein [Flavimaricola marinus]|uniref:Uncharacterized protein n=1 Tax=Flavimaricola marinus TaxID=1819565 RepID=A0A238LL66_9RHOB|nr:hypothetical protein [Flavimaricola marinus]SMY07254.1 hypothetical protein LOM8899_01387 [Flavimaricola marinus]SMY10429.1 hypothetical protein LOM8899_04612 [Flavimaricola marinus]